MFDLAHIRSLADRAMTLSTEITALRDDLDALLPLAVTPQALATIAGWPEADRDCRAHLLHALIHIGRAAASLPIAAGDLDRAATGVEI